MEPVRKLEPAPLSRSLPSPRPEPPEPPAWSVQFSDQARRNAEQIGDLARLRRQTVRPRSFANARREPDSGPSSEQQMQTLLAEQKERRERWSELYRKQVEHQEKLLKLLREAQDAWLEAFQSATKTQRRAFEKVCELWSDYFRA
jgi:hypothetical protein